jgi:glycerol-3-phosphate dehydrogenase
MPDPSELADRSMDRRGMVDRLADPGGRWDVLIVGGGATGLGVAVDAASRGYRTALVERGDFGQATSSRSTKLVHGGVRYLQQGNISLVVDALRERGRLLENAPHLVSKLRFLIPNHAWWEAPYYGAGLKSYDLLAGARSFGASGHLARREALEAIPTLKANGLRGAIAYFDGQFDDARLIVNLAQTAAEQGAVIANHVRVHQLMKDGAGAIVGAAAVDAETGRELRIHARVVINATGPFADGLRVADRPAARPIIAPSQGSHIVLPRRFLPGDSALMVPRTRDGRVLFAIPWHDHVVVGTTDTALDRVPDEPSPLPEEVDFLLETAAGYLSPEPGRADILSAWAGIRPLVRTSGRTTASLSRDHHLEASTSGLLTICGGKWTTYRRMAEDTVDRAALIGRLPKRPCRTRELPIHGHETRNLDDALSEYGSDARAIRDLIAGTPELGRLIHANPPIAEAQVVWAARREMARTVEDVLVRRTRLLPLDASAALACSGRVAEILASEIGRDEAWVQGQIEAFRRVGEAARVV